VSFLLGVERRLFSSSLFSRLSFADDERGRECSLLLLKRRRCDQLYFFPSTIWKASETVPLSTIRSW